ncbi:ATP-binding cassette domain-containing protein [Microbacterium gilvum]
MTDGKVLEFTGVTKTFDGIAAVSDFTARVDPGFVTAFLGPNGAGKTTTLRILLGQVRATSGRATIDGKTFAQLSGPRRHVGWVPESPTFRPRRTAAKHLAAVARQAGVAASRVGEVLSLVGLAEIADMRLSGYSLGMTQRLAVAEAMIGDPGVLVLDEPANGLDPEGIRWMRLLMRRLADEGRTVLVSSHLLSEIQQVADRLLVISNGSLVFAGGIEDLEDASSQTVAVDSLDRAGLSQALRAAGYSLELLRSGINVHGATAAEIGSVAAQAGVALTTLQQRSPSLEDVFLQLVKGEYVPPMTAALEPRREPDGAGAGEGADASAAEDGADTGAVAGAGAVAGGVVAGAGVTAGLASAVADEDEDEGADGGSARLEAVDVENADAEAADIDGADEETGDAYRETGDADRETTGAAAPDGEGLDGEAAEAEDAVGDAVTGEHGVGEPGDVAAVEGETAHGEGGDSETTDDTAVDPVVEDEAEADGMSVDGEAADGEAADGEAADVAADEREAADAEGDDNETTDSAADEADVEAEAHGESTDDEILIGEDADDETADGVAGEREAADAEGGDETADNAADDAGSETETGGESADGAAGEREAAHGDAAGDASVEETDSEETDSEETPTGGDAAQPGAEDAPLSEDETADDGFGAFAALGFDDDAAAASDDEASADESRADRAEEDDAPHDVSADAAPADGESADDASAHDETPRQQSEIADETADVSTRPAPSDDAFAREIAEADAFAISPALDGDHGEWRREHEAPESVTAAEREGRAHEHAPHDDADTPDAVEQADEWVPFDDGGRPHLPGSDRLANLLSGGDETIGGAAAFLGDPGAPTVAIPTIDSGATETVAIPLVPPQHDEDDSDVTAGEHPESVSFDELLRGDADERPEGDEQR